MSQSTRRATGTLGRGVTVGRAIVTRIQVTEVTFLAAAVAYYAFLSLLPALLLLLAVSSVLGGDALANTLVATTGNFLTPAGEDLVRDAVRNAAGRGGATVVGVAVLLWSMLRVFRGLDVAFLKVYGSDHASTLFDQLRDGLTVVVGIGTGLAIMVGVGTAIAAADLEGMVNVLGFGLLPAVLTVVFLPVYYIFPDVHVTVREVVPGAVFAAIGWTLLQGGFQLYAANAGQYQSYGVLGGALLLVTWFYFAAIVLLAGAVVNVVLAGRHSPSVAAYPYGLDGFGTRNAGADDRNGATTADNRQLQHSRDRQSITTPMSSEDDQRDRAKADDAGSDSAQRDGAGSSGVGSDGAGSDGPGEGREPAGAPDIAELQRDLRRLRNDLDEFEADVDARTVEKPRIETELKRYVRRRMRRGHARGWGPYLVLLYGTVLTLGAFYYLAGAYAIAAMLIVWLSTLGLYVLFVLFGLGLNVADVPVRTLNSIRKRRK